MDEARNLYRAHKERCHWRTWIAFREAQFASGEPLAAFMTPGPSPGWIGKRARL